MSDFRTYEEREAFEAWVRTPATPGLDLTGKLREAWVAARDYFTTDTTEEA